MFNTSEHHSVQNPGSHEASSGIDVQEIDNLEVDINKTAMMTKSNLTQSLYTSDKSPMPISESVLEQVVPRRNSDKSFIEKGKEINKHEQEVGQWFDTEDDLKKYIKRRTSHRGQAAQSQMDEQDERLLQPSVDVKAYRISGGSLFDDLRIGADSYDVRQVQKVDDDDDDDRDRATLKKRMFSKIETGSLRGSILGMTCAAIGSGVLTFPQVFMQIGWLNGTMLLLAGAFGCWWSLYMLIQRARHHGLLNYSAVARKAGGKCLERILSISILLYMYATCLACTIVITQLFVNISNAFGVSEEITGHAEHGITAYKSTQAVITSVLLTPLSLGRNMSSFKNLAILSLSCLIITIMVVMLELPVYMDYYQPKFETSTGEKYLQPTLVCYSSQFFSGAGIIMFAFTNQCNVLPVYSELQNPVKRRLMKIITRSIAIVLSLYLVMSFCGYFSTFQNTPQIVLSRPAPIIKWKNDWLEIIASILVMSTMVSNIVLNYMPFRNALYFMTTGGDKFSQKFNIILTICFQTAICINSIVFPNVQSVLAIFGGIASVNIVYIVPLFCYLKLRREDDPITAPKNILAIIYFSIMCLIGWGSSIGTLAQIVGQVRSKDTAKQNPFLFCQHNQALCLDPSCPCPNQGCP